MHSFPIRYCVIAATVLAAATATSTSPFAQQPQPVFRSRLNLVSVDVIVRDKSGAVVRNLTASDFEIKEDGRPQDITNFNFEEITDKGNPAVQSVDLLAGVEEKLAEENKRAASTSTTAARPAETPTPMTSDMFAGRRLITIVFDVSSMQPEDVQRAVDSANKYVEEKMSPADLVAVATVEDAPWHGRLWDTMVIPAGRQTAIPARHNLVSADYFQVMGIGLLAGRTLLFTVTAAPLRSLNTPDVTTSSPALIPERTAI